MIEFALDYVDMLNWPWSIKYPVSIETKKQNGSSKIKNLAFSIF